MPTKLSRYCDGLMEAAWLAALILVPLFFNIYSSRIFEPDKITLLRSLALVILAAWIVKLIEDRGPGLQQINPDLDRSSLKFITKFPLLLPVLALAGLYLVSTVFSVAPRTSFWGSYQRLQGTYTTLSYLVIFAAILGNLRRRAQVERILTIVVLVSIPIALYGVLQRYKIDPVPWAGDTSQRIAANMGNSIFVAAYLIMVFPVTVGRIVQSFRTILLEDEGLWSQVARATIYVFAAAIQVIALYMSGSRGPALGWLAGLFFLFLLLSLYWRARWLTISALVAALSLAVFLFIFNIEGGPLEDLRQSPAIGRFGLLLDSESNSAKVRKYIWQGAAELVKPHPPIEYPDGHIDVFNGLRPLIGYGPESMYVAYNPFYVPELAIVERRNASPDRSHNETWDALVITGALGIVVYLFLFTMVFYYGLKWIGLIPSPGQRNIFLGLWLGGGILGAIGMSFWRDVAYFGVGLPFGMLVGLLVYLAVVAILGRYRPAETEGERSRYLILIVLISAILSHFVEINFGIAIASTRTYFWTYVALMVVVGYVAPKIPVQEYSGGANEPGRENFSSEPRKLATSKKKRRSRNILSSTSSDWIGRNREAIALGLLVSIVMTTLVFDFVSNQRGLKSTLPIIWQALTLLPRQNYSFSFGVLLMVFTSWLFMGVVWATEMNTLNFRSWWKGLALVLGVSLVLGLLYAISQAGALATISRNSATSMEEVMDQVLRFEGLLSRYYIAIFVTLLALAFVLPGSIPTRTNPSKTAGIITAVVMLFGVCVIGFYTNVRVIQSDIVYKIADPFTRSGQWPVAIDIYRRANELAPNEDYYYLFLGRAYLEHAKTLKDANEIDKFVQQAELDLLKAQSLNPLNTDHTANLARLYSTWATYASDPALRSERAEISSDYFSKSLKMSRNSAVLWDEWAYLMLTMLDEPEEAYKKIARAIEIDPQYHRNYALLGEYYLRKGDLSSRNEDFQEAIKNLNKALELPAQYEPAAKFNYAQMLASVYGQNGQFLDAVRAYQQAIQLAPKGTGVWQIYETIAALYAQIGDDGNALINLQSALNTAPDDQKERLESLIGSLQPTPQP